MMDVLNYLSCPKCKGKIVVKNNNLVCGYCHQKLVIARGNIMEAMPKRLTTDTKLSLGKWEQTYQESLCRKFYESEKQEYNRMYLKDTLDQIFADYKPKKNDVYLEIGCGPMFLGQEIAKRGLKIIGIDFSLSALIIAQRMLEEGGVKNYLLIHGDIQNMPLRKNSIDLIYGGGVIEHFQDTNLVVSEMYRILRDGGVCFNSVPQLNLGSLTYRQVWGNIPDFPILKSIAEFIHIKILKKKHMRFGYELSFRKKIIKKIFEKHGFSRVTVKKFRCILSFEYLKFSWLKTIAQKLSKLEVFNPMILVVARK